MKMIYITVLHLINYIKIAMNIMKKQVNCGANFQVYLKMINALFIGWSVNI